MTQPRVKPTFFETASTFRSWLERHALDRTELWVGYHKVGSGIPSMTWSESVDEALCFGWIDGVRQRIDDRAYQIRFSPRKTTSSWSAINIAKFHELKSQGRMTVLGEKSFAARKEEKSRVYAYEQSKTAELTMQELRQFKKDTAAWSFFESTPPGYRKVLLHWVTTAKKSGTREARLCRLIEASSAGIRLR